MFDTVARRLLFFGFVWCLSACYTYRPLTNPQPQPGTQLSVLLNDSGRAEVQRQVGPYTMRIEGRLVQATDADYVLAISDVVDIRGRRARWTGEQLQLPRSYVATSSERRFSRTRTALLAAAVATGFAVLVTTWKVLGFGDLFGAGDDKPPDPNDQ